MVSRIDKFLLRLTEKERQRIEKATDKLFGDWKNAGDVKPLKGFKDIFRLRVGRFRIVFQVKNNKVSLLKVGVRDEHFYD